MELSPSLRARLELRNLREQVARIVEAAQDKRSTDLKAAHFAASMHLTELGGLIEKMALEGSQGASSDFCAVPGCGCDSKEGDCDEPV